MGGFLSLVLCTCAHITTSVSPPWPCIHRREVQRCQRCLGTPWANGVDLMLASTPASIREVGLMVCEAVRARRRNHQLQTLPQAFEAIPGSALSRHVGGCPDRTVGSFDTRVSVGHASRAGLQHCGCARGRPTQRAISKCSLEKKRAFLVNVTLLSHILTKQASWSYLMNIKWCGPRAETNGNGCGSTPSG